MAAVAMARRQRGFGCVHSREGRASAHITRRPRQLALNPLSFSGEVSQGRGPIGSQEQDLETSPIISQLPPILGEKGPDQVHSPEAK